MSGGTGVPSEARRLHEAFVRHGVEHYHSEGEVDWGYEDPHTAIESLDGTLMVSGRTAEQVMAALGLVGGTCRSAADGRREAQMCDGARTPSMPHRAGRRASWVTSLRHVEPKSIRDAVEGIVYDVMCHGWSMGPNDVEANGVNEGDVLNEAWMSDWVKTIEDVVNNIDKE